MKLGSRVTWTSQSGGSATSKSGTIVEVLPAGSYISEVLRRYELTHRFQYGGGICRNHETYLVEVLAKGKGRPVLYWPRVSQLRGRDA